MARYRTIKPELCADEKLTACSVDARFLFLCLLMFADDKGRKQDSPRRIKAEVFPADDEFTIPVVEALIQELVSVGVVERYEVGRGHFLRIVHFGDHQVINRPAHPLCPPSPTETKEQVFCKCKYCAFNGQQVKWVKSPSLSGSDHGTFMEDSVNTQGVSTIGVELNGEEVNQNQHLSATLPANGKPQALDPQGDRQSRVKERNARSVALDEIAEQLCYTLGISATPFILMVLTKTIEIRAEVEKCSVELAANKLAGRAAAQAQAAVPDPWVLWLKDARYDFMAQGDKRLNQRDFNGRPICGGSLCSGGWEPITVEGGRVLRRCPACVQLWEDLRLEE